MAPDRSPAAVVDFQSMTDSKLLADCDVQTYRASGPGGQNRNKVETAVRIRHRASGIAVTATESRSQAENRARALRRLRQALVLGVRSEVEEGDGVPPAIAAIVDKNGRLAVGRRDARYLPAAGALLDVFLTKKGSVRDTAARVGVSTGNLSRFLVADDDLMPAANRIRAQFGLKPLIR